MNYKEIGIRIRRLRKEKNLTQEQLAEKINISTTHMSHIETGATKLSLPVLVDIAHSLNTSVDDLLCDKEYVFSEYKEMILYSIADCSQKELKIIYSVISALAKNLKKDLIS